MFDNIAPRYDLLNHTLSLNIDRLWRRRVVRELLPGRPERILDMATGTGDLAIELARRIPGAQVTGVDLSERMLAEARRKVAARGLAERVTLQQGDAERLAAADASFDAATVEIGLCITRVLLFKIYSPISPIKNNCIPPIINTPIISAAVPAVKLCQ